MPVTNGGLTVEIMDHRGIALVDLSGELAGEAARALPDAIDQLDAAITNLTLGLASVSSIDLRGIEALLEASDRAGRRRLPMQLIGLSSEVRRTLEASDTTGVLDIVE